MKKQIWKPGNMLYPFAGCVGRMSEMLTGIPNLLTVAWTGTVCTNPPMLYISVRPERYSYDLIRESRGIYGESDDREVGKSDGLLRCTFGTEMWTNGKKPI